MSANNPLGSERAWHMAIANLQREVGRMQATAAAIPAEDNLGAGVSAVTSIADLVERHARCLRDYEVALNCVMALLHSRFETCNESPGRVP